MDWFQETADPRTVDKALLAQEIRRAKEMDDPWYVLKDLSLLGLEIVRSQ
jgi:hypothetical protein